MAARPAGLGRRRRRRGCVRRPGALTRRRRAKRRRARVGEFAGNGVPARNLVLRLYLASENSFKLAYDGFEPAVRTSTSL